MDDAVALATGYRALFCELLIISKLYIFVNTLQEGLFEMNGSNNERPITDLHLTKLHSLLPHFNSDTIALSLARWPKVIVDSVAAVKIAMASPALPNEETRWSPATISRVRNSFEFLHEYFSRPQLWEKSGFSFMQLDSIRLAFMAALPLQEDLSNIAESKAWHDRRTSEIEREASINKRIRHLG